MVAKDRLFQVHCINPVYFSRYVRGCMGGNQEEGLKFISLWPQCSESDWNFRKGEERGELLLSSRASSALWNFLNAEWKRQWQKYSLGNTWEEQAACLQHGPHSVLSYGGNRMGEPFLRMQRRLQCLFQPTVSQLLHTWRKGTSPETLIRTDFFQASLTQQFWCSLLPLSSCLTAFTFVLTSYK